MKRYIAVLFTAISTNAFSQEPAVIHGQFGFQPAGWEGRELSAAQKADLEDCVSAASKQSSMSKEDRAALNSLYGLKGETDFYGATLSGCLADRRDGKGWTVVKRTGQTWEPVTGRYAQRSFMGLDPSK